MYTLDDHHDDFSSQHPSEPAGTEILTPTHSTIPAFDHYERDGNSPPVPGKTYIIRCMESDRQITLLEGQVVLAKPGSLGSPYWHCVETNGWLGFRNVATNRFLGHDGHKPGDLVCAAEKHRLWEWFQVDQHRSMTAGYALRIEYWAGLRPIATRTENELEKLERVQDEHKHGLVWSFVDVS